MAKANLYFVAIIVLTMRFETVVQAQQDPLFSHFFYHTIYYNPAGVGIFDQTHVSLTHRNQWIGYIATDGSSAAPVSTMFLTDTKIRAINSGLGLVLMQDELGPLRNQRISGNCAFQSAIGNGNLSIGLGVGVSSVYMNQNMWRAAQENDNRLLNIPFQDHVYEFSGGIYYNSNTFFAGFSSRNLTQPKLFQQQILGITYTSKQILHHYLMAGYRFYINEQFVLTSSLFARSITEIQNYSLESNVMISYMNDRLIGGVSYRLSEGLVGIIGFSFLKNTPLRISYAFDLSFSGRTAKAATSHEIMVGFSAPLAPIKQKPPVRTPRFRF